MNMERKRQAQQAGGAATALILRAAAEAAYLAAPKNCHECKAAILPQPGVKLQRTRRLKFCSRSCANASSNRLRKHPRLAEQVSAICKLCGEPFSYINTNRGKGSRNYCSKKCANRAGAATRGILPNDGEMTKGALFAARGNWQSARSTIQRGARSAFLLSGKARSCSVCGYSKTFDVAHIKAVASFPDSATLGQINHPDNLLALCPNHHWEFDAGLLDVQTAP